MADGPDPADEETTSEPLGDTVHEGVGMDRFLAHASGEHGAEAGPPDVEDEEGESGAGRELHNGLLALSAGIGVMSPPIHDHTIRILSFGGSFIVGHSI